MNTIIIQLIRLLIIFIIMFIGYMISLSFDGHTFILGVVFGATAHAISDIIERETKESVKK